ncbi:hypothetical protein [Paraburkholderia sp. Ac-20347]|uniref:hypothetical protein n=1 Tax=Paraburkholderia sp. Ac-20347 TaxID=2703892 RepID=UPI00197EE2BB|nr:hypothetical protein [Paraburkholderia sp. Ac-20347]MBN3813658.1 hypothetical protein [Paraburkholderia sp. Ac-20347]
MNTMTRAQYARRIGKSRATITEWAQTGRIVMHGDFVDVAASDAKLRTYRSGGMPKVVNSAPSVKRGRPTAAAAKARADAPPPVPAPVKNESLRPVEELLSLAPGEMSLAEARYVKEVYLGKLAQLEYDLKTGLAVEVEPIRERIGEEYSIVRAKLLAVPSEQASRIHRCRSVAEIEDTLHGIISRILDELKADKVALPALPA